MKTPRQHLSEVLHETKNVIKHGIKFNHFITTSKARIDFKKRLMKIDNCALSFSCRHNRMSERSLSNSLIKLPHISDTIFLPQQDSMVQLQQQREMMIHKTPRRRNPSEIRFHNEIFNKTIFSDLLYEESLIFHRKAYYQELVNKQIDFFKKTKNDNLTEILQQTIIDKDNREMEVILTSLKVRFVNDLENISFEFILPFALLPVYYAMPLNKFNLLLCGLVKFNENFDSITIDESYIYKFLEHEFSKEKTFKTQVGNNEIEIDDSKRIFMQRCKSKAHVHIFNWLTPIRHYKVNIIEPHINLCLVDNHIRFNKYIDYELLFYLYEKKFVNWEFYTINYLFSYKKVRSVFDKLVSKTSNDKIENIVLNINRDQFDDYSSYDTTNDYISTNDNFETTLYRIKSGNISLKYHYIGISEDYKTDYSIKLSIGQMKMLLMMSMKYDQFISFVKRFITVQPFIKRVNIVFDYDKLDTFPIESFHEEITGCDRSNESQNMGNDSYSIIVSCGMLEVYSLQERQGCYSLVESIELTKDNASPLFNEKNWKYGQALLSIKQDEVRLKKKLTTTIGPRTHSSSNIKGKKTVKLIAGSHRFKHIVLNIIQK